MSVSDLVRRISDRSTPRTEATLQADIRQLLLQGGIGLETVHLEDVNLETPVGDRRRIDIEIGSCVIEVKKSLEYPKVLAAAAQQLEGYLVKRLEQTGLRYVGILTDGLLWVCYHVRGAQAEEVTRLIVPAGADAVESLLAWLEGVLATARDVAPTPDNIKSKLGSSSSAYHLDRTTLAALFLDNARIPAVVAKRTLWARLLTTALGTGFQDDDELFIEHSLLVLSAEVIAHAVLGLDPAALSPGRLVTGAEFEEAGVHGVVEADFFDWVVEVDGGSAWVRSLARRLTRFRWDDVDHDVLKTLYESIIKPETRRKLGEYYTPDWLAEKIVADVYKAPLEQRLLDPACGSGTFLFHAVRRYLAASGEGEVEVAGALRGLSEAVVGMDLHPVAVTLARVTYLLAIGRDRLANPQRGSIRIPVYLGDSLQWQFSAPNLWTAGNLSVRTDAQPNLFESELLFPDALLGEPMLFDELVEQMARMATERAKGSTPPKLDGMYDRLNVAEAYRAVLTETFTKLCHLNDADRDHIWSYYVRNLARPTWLSRPANRVDVLVGNPPWLAYRNMTPEMQEAFRSMSQARELWHGAEVATHQDLSALFIARAVELYLRQGGDFAMVVPNAVLDRAQFAGFRAGLLGDLETGHVAVAFGRPWDLRRLRPHFFPRGAAVVFGKRSVTPGAMSDTVDAWAGRLGATSDGWAVVSKTVVRERREIYRSSSVSTSSYGERFAQGAALIPRCLFFVEAAEDSPLGVPKGHRRVRSSRSANEKPPWRDIPDRVRVVETAFVHPVLAGQLMVPYRIYAQLEAVVPLKDDGIIAEDPSKMTRYPRLSAWWEEAEQIWEANRSSERLSLAGQMDYRRKLSRQLEEAGPRVVYSKSGMHMVAARVKSGRFLVNDSLYWATVRSGDEAVYLCAVLNARALTMAVRPLMSYGKDERHFDKYVWQVGIPDFDPTDAAHAEIVRLGLEVEAYVSSLELPADLYFVTARTQVREALDCHQGAQELESAVDALLASA